MKNDKKNIYKKLILELSELFIRFIDELPNNDCAIKINDMNDTVEKSIWYSQNETKQKTIRFD